MVAAKPGKRRRVRPGQFYNASLTEGERDMMPAALTMEGFDEEIALLRVKLATAAREHTDDLRLLTDGIALLVRAVAAKYRLSPKASDDLAQHLAATFNRIADQVLPADR